MFVIRLTPPDKGSGVALLGPFKAKDSGRGSAFERLRKAQFQQSKKNPNRWWWNCDDGTRKIAMIEELLAPEKSHWLDALPPE